MHRGRAIPAELRGILITLAAMLLFGLMDAGSKFLSTRYPVPQILWPLVVGMNERQWKEQAGTAATSIRR